MLEKDLTERVTNLEKGTIQTFKVVFQQLDELKEIVEPRLPRNRKKVGLKT